MAAVISEARSIGRLEKPPKPPTSMSDDWCTIPILYISTSRTVSDSFFFFFFVYSLLVCDLSRS